MIPAPLEELDMSSVPFFIGLICVVTEGGGSVSFGLTVFILQVSMRIFSIVLLCIGDDGFGIYLAVYGV